MTENTKKAKVYSSFEELDRDLEILRTERTLYYLKMKQDVGHVTDKLTIGHLIQPLMSDWKDQAYSLVKVVIRKSLWPLLTTLLLKWLRKK